MFKRRDAFVFSTDRAVKIELEKNNVKLKAADRRQLKSDIGSYFYFRLIYIYLSCKLLVFALSYNIKSNSECVGDFTLCVGELTSNL